VTHDGPGIEVTTQSGESHALGPANDDLAFFHNSVFGANDAGFAAYDDTMAASVLHANLFDGNYFGINISGGNVGNVIDQNIVALSRFIDCTDSSSGSGTAGTANTWQNNTGNTSNPPGICAPPKH
jgi:nitrous oxidase accessory protein NosD